MTNSAATPSDGFQNFRNIPSKFALKELEIWGDDEMGRGASFAASVILM